MSISMDRRSIILVPSCFSRQNASNDIHDDPNGPTLQIDLGDCQCRHITMNFIVCGVTPPKRAVLPECYPFSEKKVLYRSLIRKTAKEKRRNGSPMYDDRNKRHLKIKMA